MLKFHDKKFMKIIKKSNMEKYWEKFYEDVEN